MPCSSRTCCALLLAIASVLLPACGGNSAADQRVTPRLGPRVQVFVTTDGGNKLVVEHSLRIERGMSALDVLESVADVELGPGGEVLRINGLGGGRVMLLGPEPAGWYYRVNGIEADMPPQRYVMEPGSVLWWDLRRFDAYPVIPLAVGAFPEPFFSGYRNRVRPMRIAHGEGLEDVAREFEKLFEQIDPDVDPIEDGGGPIVGAGEGRPVPNIAVRSRRSNLVIATWDEARLDPYIADIAYDPRTYGITTWIEGPTVRRQEPSQEFSEELPDAVGLVWATTLDGEPDGPPVVLVTGFDREGVEAAARALMRGAFTHELAGAVDGEGNVIR